MPYFEILFLPGTLPSISSMSGLGKVLSDVYIEAGEKSTQDSWASWVSTDGLDQ